jgi:hypothetical protein
VKCKTIIPAWKVLAWGDRRECSTVESVLDEVRDALELGCLQIVILKTEKDSEQ